MDAANTLHKIIKNRTHYLLLALFLFSQAAFSQDWDSHPFHEDRFMIEAGVFNLTRQLKLSADGTSENDEINFNETFNLSDNEPTYYLRVGWRFSKNRKWAVSLEGFGINAGNRLTLEEDVEFEDIIFEEGSFVRVGVTLEVYRLFFSRQMLNSKRHNLELGVGVHGLRMGTFIEGEVRTSEGDFRPERRDIEGLIPLPNLGVGYYFIPHKRWMIGANLDWLGLTIDQYSGSLWNFAPRVKFNIIRNFGVGFDYRFFVLNAKVSGANWNGGFDMSFQGPVFSLHGNF